MTIYHIYIKSKGCQGKGCRRCEDFLPGFFDDHCGDMKFNDLALDNQGVRSMIFGAIDNCPAGCLGWDRL